MSDADDEVFLLKPGHIPDEYEKLVDQHIKDQNNNKAKIKANNYPKIDAEWNLKLLDHAYDYFLHRSKYILDGIHARKYDEENPWEAIQHVIQNDNYLNADFVSIIREILVDSINMKLEIKKLEQTIWHLKKKGGSSKLYKNIKTIKNRSRK